MWGAALCPLLCVWEDHLHGRRGRTRLWPCDHWTLSLRPERTGWRPHPPHLECVSSWAGGQVLLSAPSLPRPLCSLLAASGLHGWQAGRQPGMGTRQLMHLGHGDGSLLPSPSESRGWVAAGSSPSHPGDQEEEETGPQTGHLEAQVGRAPSGWGWGTEGLCPPWTVWEELVGGLAPLPRGPLLPRPSTFSVFPSFGRTWAFPGLQTAWLCPVP